MIHVPTWPLRSKWELEAICVDWYIHGDDGTSVDISRSDTLDDWIYKVPRPVADEMLKLHKEYNDKLWVLLRGGDDL